jgi:hypothetical protein
VGYRKHRAEAVIELAGTGLIITILVIVILVLIALWFLRRL